MLSVFTQKACYRHSRRVPVAGCMVWYNRLKLSCLHTPPMVCKERLESTLPASPMLRQGSAQVPGEEKRAEVLYVGAVGSILIYDL